jgi:hypothetical protein
MNRRNPLLITFRIFMAMPFMKDRTASSDAIRSPF